MNVQPDARELVNAVARWLREADAGATFGFERRVAANALDIVARELELAPVAEARAVSRLERLTGSVGDLATLEAMLCARIRDGAIALDSPLLRDHLARTALDRLAIDQPGYAHQLTIPAEDVA